MLHDFSKWYVIPTQELNMLMSVLEMFPVFACTRNVQFRSLSRFNTEGQSCLGFLIYYILIEKNSFNSIVSFFNFPRYIN